MSGTLAEIGAKIVLDGESSFRKALTACNANLREMKSALTLTEAEYESNADSVEALTAKSKKLSDVYDAQKTKIEKLSEIIDKCKENKDKFQKSAEETAAKLDKEKQELEKIKEASGESSEEFKKQETVVKDLTEEYKEQIAAQEKWTAKQSYYTTQSNKAKTEQKKLSNTLKECNKQLEEAERQLSESAESAGDYTKGIKQASAESGNFSKRTADATEALSTVIAASGAQQAIDKIKSSIEDCTDASIEFESAIAGVYKTVDGTDEQLKNISNGIQELSYNIPATSTQIASAAEQAGQLGIATDNILDFTEVTIGMGEATNMTAEQAASDFAKIANITNMPAENYSNLASTVVELGNNFATTESDIVAMAMRMSSAASMAGFTQAQIMALATALSSVGNEAEAGGSAASKLITMIDTAVQTGEGLEDFANIAGVSAQEFAQAWGENAAGALTMFITGLSDFDRLGKTTTVLLQELGIKELRLSNAARSLASDHTGLAAAFNLADKAWAENSALQEEVSKRYATTESKMKILQNRTTGLKIAVGNALTPTLNNLAAVGGDLLEGATKFVEKHPEVVKGITAVTIAGGVFIGTATTAAVAIKLVKMAMDDATLGTTAIISAIVALTAALGTLVITNLNTTESYDELTEATRSAKDAFNDIDEAYKSTITSSDASAAAASRYIDRLAELEGQGLDTAQAQQEYKTLVEALKSAVPELTIEIDEQTGVIKGGAAALRENVEAWKENIKAQAMASMLKEKYEALFKAQIAASESSQTLAEKEEEISAAELKRAQALDTLAAATNKDRVEIAKIIQTNGSYISELRKIAPDAVAQYESQTQALDNLYEQQRLIAEANEENESTLEDLTADYEKVEESITGTTEAMQGNATAQEELADAATETTGTLNAEVTTLTEAYNESYDAARESIEGQTSLFEKFNKKAAELGAEDIRTNMQANAASLEEFSNAYSKAAEMGYDKEFLSQFEDFNPNNLSILNDLIKETPDGVNNFNKVWADFEGSKDTYASTIAQVVTDFNDTMDTVLKKANETADQLAMRDKTGKSARDFTDGFISTINSKLPDFYSVGYKAGSRVVAGFNAAQDIHSPSRETAKSADFFAEGFILQLSQREKDMEAVVMESAHLMTAAMYSFTPPDYGRYSAAPPIDTAAITAAVRQGMIDANISVDFDYRGFKKGLNKYER